jgi:phage anti-repressor protein
MKTEITTLEQAGKHLMNEGVVNFEDMSVEGKQLLDVCGYRTDSDVKKTIERQINKHKFNEGVDFTKGIDASSESRKKPMVYKFTMNAANHVLLAAFTEQGKAARQEAIDLSTTVQENGGEQMLMEFIKQQQQFMLDMKDGFKDTLRLALDKKEEDSRIMLFKKSEPISLTKMYSGSSKVAQSANIWLEYEGYQTKRFIGQESAGWTLTDKGRELGTQINPAQVFWVPEIKDELPSIIDLLDFAERLGLKDMKKSD